MIISVTEEMRRKMTKDGSVLKYLRNTGGMNKGCFAGGIFLVIAAAVLGVSFKSIPIVGLFFGGIFGIPGVLMLLMGFIFQKKKVNGYLSFYQKESGYGAEEIKRIDQELLASDVICISTMPAGTALKDLQVGCFITRNYLVMPSPLGKSYIRRLEDVMAAIYCKTIPGIGGYKQGLVFVSKQDDELYYNANFTISSCNEVIQALHDRNPQIITDQFYERNGVQFDLLKDWRTLNS